MAVESHFSSFKNTTKVFDGSSRIRREVDFTYSEQLHGYDYDDANRNVNLFLTLLSQVIVEVLLA